MNNSIRFLSLLIIVFTTLFFVNGIHKSDIPLKTNTHENYKIKALKIPENLNFAGERVPLENPNIFERMDRELLVNTYWQSNGLLLFKRANKYFPVLEPLLKKHGLPDDFKFLALAESAFIDETSSAGAAGMWHFMVETGKEYGLEINSNVDERYNIEKSTAVAAEYLKKSKEKLGSWTLAAAAYNAGNFGVSSRLEAQKVNSYYDVLLTEETARYVYRILALKEIMKNPQKYGFEIPAHALYSEIPVKKIEVDSTVTDLADFALSQGINYKILKIHNPWLRDKSLPNKSKKKYEIAIPTAGYSKE